MTFIHIVQTVSLNYIAEALHLITSRLAGSEIVNNVYISFTAKLSFYLGNLVGTNGLRGSE